jgi:hypothetical protein
MEFNIKFESPPLGYVVTAARGGQVVQVLAREFTSSEDGDHFISRLEGYPSTILSMLPSRVDIRPSSVDSLLAIISRDGNATVYINHPCTLEINARGAIEVGDPITDDNIVDIERFKFDGIHCPVDCGIVVILSVGWRRGLYYDFVPLHEPYPPRPYDLNVLLGHYFSYIANQHLFKLTDEDWSGFISQKWFPFVGLKSATVKNMIAYVRSGWSIDELLDDISKDCRDLAATLLDRWRNKPYFIEHERVFSTAISRYLQEDYVSSTSILYTRLEGLLHSILMYSGGKSTTNQKVLLQTALGNSEVRKSGYSKLLPGRFQEYLNKVIFAGYHLDAVNGVSRHSIAHGIANPDEFNRKSSIIGLLVLDQLFYYQPIAAPGQSRET